MKVLVTGASGLLGREVVSRLEAEGHACLPLSRAGAGLRWGALGGAEARATLRGVDAAVHLAGESIAGGRWTGPRRRRILASRAELTAELAASLAALDAPPRVLVSASAVGLYGDRGDEVLTEESAPGAGFLADVCRAWEGATAPAEAAGIRVVHARFGLVLSGRGGLLARLRPLFSAGLGGTLGSGRQFMSWVTLRDAAGAVTRALGDAGLRGPLVVAAPGAATNVQFTRALARALGRWTGPPAPAFALKLAFGGEMARELLLAGQRCHPAKLLAAGYAFLDPELEPALRKLLG